MGVTVIEGATPDLDEPAAVPAPASAPPESPAGEPATFTNIEQVVSHYVRMLVQYVNSQPPIINVPKLDEATLRLYVPYLRFNSELGLDIASIAKSDYIALVKQTTPELGEVLECTDAGDALPIMVDPLRPDLLSDPLKILGFKQEIGYQEAEKLSRASQNLVCIPDLVSLSLFMFTGEDFRDYLRTVDIPLSPSPTWCRGQFKQPNTGNYLWETRIGNVPPADFLFAPKYLLSYAKSSGRRDLMKIIAEYKDLHTLCTSNGDLINQSLYARLKTANPKLCI